MRSFNGSQNTRVNRVQQRNPFWFHLGHSTATIIKEDGVLPLVGVAWLPLCLQLIFLQLLFVFVFGFFGKLLIFFDVNLFREKRMYHLLLRKASTEGDKFGKATTVETESVVVRQPGFF